MSDADKQAFKVLSRNSDMDGLANLFDKYQDVPDSVYQGLKSLNNDIADAVADYINVSTDTEA